MGSRRARLTLAAAAVAALLAAPPAGAQPSPADRETARSMMQEGRDLREKGDLKSALVRFKSADEIMHVPTTGLEVARTQVSLGLLVEALDTIAMIRKLPSGPDDPAPFKDARSKAEDLATQIENKVPTLNISITGGTEGETPAISIDGNSIPAGAAGVPRKIDPGHHVISAKGAAGEATEEIDVADGEKKDVSLVLVKGGGGESEPEQASQGNRKVVHSPNGLTWAGVGVAGVGLVTGIITGVMTLSKASALKTECDASKKCLDGSPGGSDYKSGNTLATVADVGFVVAGAGAVLAITSLIVGHRAPDATPASAPPSDSESPAADPDATPPAPEQSRLHVQPWIGLGSAGVFGTF